MASESVNRFVLLTRAEVYNLPEPSWLIDGILPTNALAVLYGLPGAGKTFVALSMALSIAAGHLWCGKGTKSGSVLYVAAEGLRGLQFRMQAYEGKHSIVAEHLQCLGQEFDLRSFVDIQELATAMEARDFHPDFIVLDTFARLIPGADENSSKDVGQAIRAMDELRRRFGATVLLVHHTGKDGGLGAWVRCSTRRGRRDDKMREERPKLHFFELHQDEG